MPKNPLDLSAKYLPLISYQNGRTLQVLDLFGCKGLNLASIQHIVKNFVELTEVNFSSTGLARDSIDFLANNITSKVQKIGLFDLHFGNKNVEDLVTRFV